MNVLIAGGGNIGLRHLTNIRDEEPSSWITLWHTSGQLSTTNGAINYADNVVTNVEDALRSKPDVALITCPTSLHVPIGLVLAEQGVDLFIEKPLSDTMSGVDKFLQVCRMQDVVLMVGYNYRFYRPLEVIRDALQRDLIGRFVAIRAEVGQYLPDWRARDYRHTVSARSELGGGVVLELSHELDYVRWLAGEVRAVQAQTNRISDLEINVEDTADILLQFESGIVGNVHMNMVQRTPSRTCQLVGTEGVIKWNGLTHRTLMYTSDVGSWEDLYSAVDYDFNDMYRMEVRYFLDCVRKRRQPITDGNEGYRVLEIALAIKKSSELRAVVEV